MQKTEPRILDSEIFRAKVSANFYWVLFFLSNDEEICMKAPKSMSSPIIMKDGKYSIHSEVVEYSTSAKMYLCLLDKFCKIKNVPSEFGSLTDPLLIFEKFTSSLKIAPTQPTHLVQDNPFLIGEHIQLLDHFMVIVSNHFAPTRCLTKTILKLNEKYSECDLEACDHQGLLFRWIESVSRKIKPNSSSMIGTCFADFVSNGYSLPALLVYYIPMSSKVGGIDENSLERCGGEWKINNIKLFQSICSQNFSISILSLSPQDMLRADTMILPNLEVTISEVFSFVEHSSFESFVENEDTRFYSAIDQNLHVSSHSDSGDESPDNIEYIEDDITEPNFGSFLLQKDVPKEEEKALEENQLPNRSALQISKDEIKVNREEGKVYVEETKVNGEELKVNEEDLDPIDASLQNNMGLGYITDTDILAISEKIESMYKLLGPTKTETIKPDENGKKSVPAKEKENLNTIDQVISPKNSAFMLFSSAKDLKEAEYYESKRKQVLEKLESRKKQTTDTSRRDNNSLNSGIIIKPHTNKPIIKNALIHFCFVVRSNSGPKDEAIMALEESCQSHYLIRFHDINNFRLQFRGIYYLDSNSNTAKKIYGHGPDVVEKESVKSVYRYVCSLKQFKIIELSKTLSIACDGFTITSKSR